MVLQFYYGCEDDDCAGLISGLSNDLEIIGIYLLEPDYDRKKESKGKKRKRKEKYESTRETYLRVIKDPLLSNYFDANLELLKKLNQMQKLY